MSDRLIQLENELRSAVTRGSYAQAQRAVTAYCAQAADEWRALPLGDSRAHRIFDHLQEVLEWVRLMLSTSRASTAAEVRRVRLAKGYLAPRSVPQSRLRLDA